MENVVFSMNAVFPLFLMVAIGYALTRKGMMTKSFAETLSDLGFHFFLPVMLFRETYQSALLSGFRGKLTLFCLLGILAMALAGALVWPFLVKDRKKCGAAVHSTFRTNFILLGIPLLKELCGQPGMEAAATVLPFAVAEFNILAVLVFTAFGPNAKDGKGKINWAGMFLGVLKNPLIIGIIAGLLFQLLRIPLIGFVSKTIDYCSNMATPMILLAVGGQFSFKAARENIRYSVPLVVIRGIVFPILFTGIGYLMGFRGPELAVIFVLFGSPTAVSGAPMARAMGSDAGLTAEVTLFTSLFSIVTFFFGTWILRSFGLI